MAPAGCRSRFSGRVTELISRFGINHRRALHVSTTISRQRPSPFLPCCLCLSISPRIPRIRPARMFRAASARWSRSSCLAQSSPFVSANSRTLARSTLDSTLRSKAHSGSNAQGQWRRYSSTSSSSASSGHDVPFWAIFLACTASATLGVYIARALPSSHPVLEVVSPQARLEEPLSAEPVTATAVTTGKQTPDEVLRYATLEEVQLAIAELREILGAEKVSTDEDELTTHGYSTNDYHPGVCFRHPFIVFRGGCSAVPRQASLTRSSSTQIAQTTSSRSSSSRTSTASPWSHMAAGRVWRATSPRYALTLYLHLPLTNLPNRIALEAYVSTCDLWT